MREKRGKKTKGVCGVCVRERRDLHLHEFFGVLVSNRRQMKMKMNKKKKESK